MELTAKFLEAVSTLLWPLILCALLLFIREPVSEIIRTAKSRRFTIKIGGQELTMEEANEQQRALNSDLQAQIADIRRAIRERTQFEGLEAPKPATIPLNDISSILWVDDNPKRNSYFIDELDKLGIRVDLARSTSEGLSRLSSRRYSALISNVTRDEGEKINPRAGLDLLTAVRERFPKIPFIIFCGAQNAQRVGQEAIKLGASGVTTSSTELYALLNLEQLRQKV